MVCFICYHGIIWQLNTLHFYWPTASKDEKKVAFLHLVPLWINNALILKINDLFCVQNYRNPIFKIYLKFSNSHSLVFIPALYVARVITLIRNNYLLGITYLNITKHYFFKNVSNLPSVYYESTKQSFDLAKENIHPHQNVSAMEIWILSISQPNVWRLIIHCCH